MLTENIQNLDQIELDMLSADIVDHNPSVNERDPVLCRPQQIG